MITPAPSVRWVFAVILAVIGLLVLLKVATPDALIVALIAIFAALGLVF